MLLVKLQKLNSLIECVIFFIVQIRTQKDFHGRKRYWEYTHLSNFKMDTVDKQVDGVVDLTDIVMKPEISEYLELLSTTLPYDNTPTDKIGNLEGQDETDMVVTQEEYTDETVYKQKNYHNEVFESQQNLKPNSFEFFNNQNNDGHYHQKGYGDPVENYSEVGEEYENDNEMSNTTQDHIDMLESLLEVNSDGNGNTTQDHIDMLESLLEVNSDGNGNNTYTNNAGYYTNRTYNTNTNTIDNHTNKLFVCNIPFQMPEEELIQIFSEFGRIKNFKLINDTQGGRHLVKRYAFISYFVVNEMKAALSLNGRYMYNRKMVVRVFQSRQTSTKNYSNSKIYNRKRK